MTHYQNLQSVDGMMTLQLWASSYSSPDASISCSLQAGPARPTRTKKTARHKRVSPKFKQQKNYRERRKFTRFCWSAKLRAAAVLSEVLASDPLLPWALMAV